MKKILTISLLLFSVFFVIAQDVSFKATAPRVVTMNENFRLTYTFNQKPKDLKVPELTNFMIVAGPSISQSTNVQIVNNKMIKNATYSYTYVVRAKKIGKFKIEPAIATIQKEKYKSISLDIEVIEEGASQTQNTQTTQANNTSSGQEVSDKDLFLKLIPSKRSVYQGEHLVVTLNMYSRVNLSNIVDDQRPSYKGFYKLILEEPTQISFIRENVNGSIYEKGLMQKVLLYPQQSGEMKVDAATAEFVIRQRVSSTNVFDDFFGSNVQNVRKRVTAPGLNIKVKPLPEGAPDSFTNAVGSFSVQSTIDKSTVKANEAISFKLKISGTGNLKLIETPNIEFSPDFEIYDPKISENIKNSENGSSGSKTFEYLIIPRHEGTFEIPSFEFTYFDPKLKEYKTLHTKNFELNVEKDESVTSSNVTVSGINKEDVKYLGKDIRYLKSGNVKFSVIDAVLFGSVKYWLFFFGIIILFVVALILLNIRYKNKKDVVLVKYKQANKVAKKRLKTAEEFLRLNNSEKFYEEILKALWGYLSDKLNIPLSELSMDNAISILSKDEVESSVIKQFTSIVTTCEYARYAPIEGESQLDIDYRKAVEVLSKFEQKIK